MNSGARSLAIHQLVVAKIRKNPHPLSSSACPAFPVAPTVCLSSQPYLIEWERLMEQGIDVTLEKAVEDSEQAADLRKPSPFAGILKNQERSAFLRVWSYRHGPNSLTESYLESYRHDAE